MCKGHIFYSKFLLRAREDECSITHTGRHFLISCSALIILLKYNQDVAGRECFILGSLETSGCFWQHIALAEGNGLVQAIKIHRLTTPKLT